MFSFSIAGISTALIFFITLTHDSSLAQSAIPVGIQTNESWVIEPASNTPKQLVPGLPKRLRIPKIKVDAAIEQVGLTPDGAMGVPKGRVNTAWYNLGPRPGEKGSSVIDGHYGWKNGLPAVFDTIHKLRPGDKIFAEDDQGVITTFVVRESRRYDPKADALGVFFSNDGLAHLNLITCGGVWNKVTKSYSQRLVVFTDKE